MNVYRSSSKYILQYTARPYVKMNELIVANILGLLMGAVKDAERMSDGTRGNLCRQQIYLALRSYTLSLSFFLRLVPFA